MLFLIIAYRSALEKAIFKFPGKSWRARKPCHPKAAAIFMHPIQFFCIISGEIPLDL